NPVAGDPTAGEAAAVELNASETQAGNPATSEAAAGEPNASEAQAGNPATGTAAAGDSEASAAAGPAVGGLPLAALVSRVLLACAVEFERETATSLAISANALRVLGADEWVPVRDLPGLSGVSKESIAMATSFLIKNGRAETGPVPLPGRGKRIRLTPA